MEMNNIMSGTKPYSDLLQGQILEFQNSRSQSFCTHLRVDQTPWKRDVALPTEDKCS